MQHNTSPSPMKNNYRISNTFHTVRKFYYCASAYLFTIACIVKLIDLIVLDSHNLYSDMEHF